MSLLHAYILDTPNFPSHIDALETRKEILWFLSLWMMLLSYMAHNVLYHQAPQQLYTVQSESQYQPQRQPQSQQQYQQYQAQPQPQQQPQYKQQYQPQRPQEQREPEEYDVSWNLTQTVT